MKSSAILTLLLEARPGRCPLCDGPMPRTPKRKYCRASDCARLYQRLYHSTYRKPHASAGENP